MDIPLWAMELAADVFLWTWLFCMGATVGSFLNVVVYRLPRNQNIAYPGSYCPHCGHPIRLQDNIPLLSWLNLSGKCRDCSGRISPRYFWVELTVAVTFLIVLAADMFLPAGSLGITTRTLLTTRDGIPFWCMYVIHVTLATTLIGGNLMRAEGSAVPVRMFVPALTLALAVPLAFPEIRSIPAMKLSPMSGWQIGLIDGFAGLLMGAAVGLLASVPARQRSWSPAVVVAIGCCLGAILGWQRTPLWFLVALPLCDLASYIVRSLGVRSASMNSAPATETASIPDPSLENERSAPL